MAIRIPKARKSLAPLLEALKGRKPSLSRVVTGWALLGLMLLCFAPYSWAANEKCVRDLIGTTADERFRVDQALDLYFDETQVLAGKIARIAPPATSEYVMVGRSLSLYNAYLEAQKLMYKTLTSWTLPLSIKNQSDLKRATLLARLARLENAYRQIPFDNSKRQVFIDTVEQGRTFTALDRLLVADGRRPLFIAVTDDPKETEEHLKKTMLSEFQVVRVSAEYLNASLFDHKNFAPYRSSYNIEGEKDPTLGLTGPVNAQAVFLDLRLQIEERLGFH